MGRGVKSILNKKKPLKISGLQNKLWSWRESLEPFHKIS